MDVVRVSRSIVEMQTSGEQLSGRFRFNEFNVTAFAKSAGSSDSRLLGERGYRRRLNRNYLIAEPCRMAAEP
jgi:hypothetical protein